MFVTGGRAPKTPMSFVMTLNVTKATPTDSTRVTATANGRALLADWAEREKLT